MKILFDQGTPVPLRKIFTAHEVRTAFEMSWGTLSNGELLQKAEDFGFNLLITTDQNLSYQQNLSQRKIAVIVLSATSWLRIQNVIPEILQSVSSIQSNEFIQVEVPYLA